MRPRPLLTTLSVLLACGDSATGTTADSGTTAAAPSTTDTPTTGTPPASTTAATDDGGQTDAMTDATATTTGASTTALTATTTDATTTAGTTSTTGETGETGETTAGTTTADTTTGDPPASCQDVDFPVTAPLCGDDGPPCALLRDEFVSPDAKFRNDMPAIALRGDCGPSVLYSVAVGDYFGFYSERTGPDTWTTESTPFKIATGSLESVPATHELLAAVDDGAYGVTVWRRTDTMWTQESALVGMNHTRAPQLARDQQGNLHLGHINEPGFMRHDVYDGAWTPQMLLPQTEIHVRITLDTKDAAHLIGWSSEAMTWQLKYLVPPAPAELITPLGSNVLDHHHTAIALAGPDETPWVLLARKQPDQLHHDIYLAHRTGPNTWPLELLFAEDPGADDECDAPPNQMGQICNYDYRRAYTTALVASADEVRALYMILHYKGTLTAQCQQFPEPFCSWTPGTDESTGELRVAWPGAAPADHQVLLTDIFTDRATARLDTLGRIHLAFYDYPPQGGDPTVRYAAVGP